MRQFAKVLSYHYGKLATNVSCMLKISFELNPIPIPNISKLLISPLFIIPGPVAIHLRLRHSDSAEGSVQGGPCTVSGPGRQETPLQALPLSSRTQS